MRLLEIAALGIALLLGGCATWKECQQNPEIALRNKLPDIVRVTLADQRQLILTFPTVQGDSLAGYLAKSDRDEPSLEDAPESERIVVALADVRNLEQLYFSSESYITGAAGILGAVGTAISIGLSQAHPKTPTVRR